MKSAVRVAVLLACLPATARADRIHLENGNVFDDVVLVSRTEATVRFLVGPGEMSLPSSWVVRIERAPGALEEYLSRSRDLATQEPPSAEGYLALARWARLQGLKHGFRESLLIAAELQPDLDGLAPLMAGVGYGLDAAGEVWLPARAAEPPALRHSDGAEREGARIGVAERLASAPAARRDTGSNVEIAAGLTRAIESLAQAELERSRRPPSSGVRSARAERLSYPLAVAPVVLVSSGWVFPGVPLRPADSDPKNPIIRKPANPYAKALLARPPGSLLPVSAYQH